MQSTAFDSECAWSNKRDLFYTYFYKDILTNAHKVYAVNLTTEATSFEDNVAQVKRIINSSDKERV